MSPAAPAATVVEPHHVGPPGCGNGGWVCGLVAERVEGLVPVTPDLMATSVRLHAPTPLATPLSWEVAGAAGEADLAVHLLAGSTHLATGRRAPAPPVAPPALLTLPEARSAAAAADLRDHPYPRCYVCGPDAEAGLHLHVGPVAAHPGLHAATVTLTEPGLPAVLAALDCPGAWAVGTGRDTLLLGTLTSWVEPEVPLGRELVVLAWEVAREGRRRRCGTALVEDGRVLGLAEATWVEVGRDHIPGTAPAATLGS